METYFFRSVQALYVILLLQDTLLGILSSGIALYFDEVKVESVTAIDA